MDGGNQGQQTFDIKSMARSWQVVGGTFPGDLGHNPAFPRFPNMGASLMADAIGLGQVLHLWEKDLG